MHIERNKYIHIYTYIYIYIYIYIYNHGINDYAKNTPPSHAKRQRTSLQPATIEALQEERAEPIVCVFLVVC